MSTVARYRSVNQRINQLRLLHAKRDKQTPTNRKKAPLNTTSLCVVTLYTEWDVTNGIAAMNGTVGHIP